MSRKISESISTGMRLALPSGGSGRFFEFEAEPESEADEKENQTMI